MKLPKSLALLMLTLAGNSIYAAEDSLGASNNQPTPTWFHPDDFPPAPSTQPYTASWKVHFTSVALPVISAGTCLAIGEAAMKKYNHPGIPFLAASAAFSSGLFAYIHGDNKWKAMGNPMHLAGSILTNTQTTFNTRITTLCANGTGAANKLINGLLAQPNLSDQDRESLNGLLTKSLEEKSDALVEFHKYRMNDALQARNNAIQAAIAPIGTYQQQTQALQTLYNESIFFYGMRIGGALAAGCTLPLVLWTAYSALGKYFPQTFPTS